MQDTYEWTEIRDDAIERFRGELPHAQTEAEIIEVFEERPRVVLRAIEEVADDVANGKVRSGWAVVRARVHGALEPLRDATAHGSEREESVLHAERWTRNAGLHFDRPEEVDDELFGDGGILRAWGAEKALRKRLLGIWQEVRPQGIQVEQEAAERVLQRKQVRARLAEIAKKERVFKGFVEPEKEEIPV